MPTRLEIEGMHCDGCVRRVQKLLDREGIGKVVSVAIGTAEIEASPADVERAVKALESAGYATKIVSA